MRFYTSLLLLDGRESTWISSLDKILPLLFVEPNETTTTPNVTVSMSKDFHGEASNVSSQEDQKKPENNQTEAVVKPTPELHNSSLDVRAGSTENFNGNVTSNEVDQSKISEVRNETVIKLNSSTDNSPGTSGTSGNSSTTETGTKSGRRLLEDDASKESADGHSDNKDTSEGVRMATVENDGALEAEADSAFDFLRDNDELSDEYSYDYEDYVNETMWGDEEWVEGQHENSEDYVNIDAHILCTPVSFIYVKKPLSWVTCFHERSYSVASFLSGNC